MDSVVREVFQNYPDNVKHYEALLASLGNMSDFLEVEVMIILK